MRSYHRAYTYFYRRRVCIGGVTTVRIRTSIVVFLRSRRPRALVYRRFIGRDGRQFGTNLLALATRAAAKMSDGARRRRQSRGSRPEAEGTHASSSIREPCWPSSMIASLTDYLIDQSCTSPALVVFHAQRNNQQGGTLFSKCNYPIFCARISQNQEQSHNITIEIFILALSNY